MPKPHKKTIRIEYTDDETGELVVRDVPPPTVRRPPQGVPDGPYEPDERIRRPAHDEIKP